MDRAARCGRVCGSSYRLQSFGRCVGDFGRSGRSWWWWCRDSGECSAASSRRDAVAELLASWRRVDSSGAQEVGGVAVSRRRYYRTP
jgi:hypothetical protein